MNKFTENNLTFILITFYLVFLMIVSIPSILMVLSNFLLFDLGQLNILSGFGPKKIFLFAILAGLFIFFKIFLLFISNKISNVKKFLFFSSALILSYGFIFIIFYPSFYLTKEHLKAQALTFNRLKMVDMSDFDFEETFFDMDAQKENIRTFSELYQFAIKRYENYRDYLQRSWSIENEEKLFSFFAMNFVSSLWGYGNPSGKGGSGCVMVNELTGFETIPPEDVTVRTYLDSPIGCCTDFTTILKFILDMRGIQNRVVLIPGHVFNEVFLDGRWWCLDANTGVVFGRSWEKINSTIPTYLFPHSNMLSHDHRFRESIGTFRTSMLTAAGNGSLKPSRYFPQNTWYREGIDYGSVFIEAIEGHHN